MPSIFGFFLDLNCTVYVAKMKFLWSYNDAKKMFQQNHLWPSLIGIKIEEVVKNSTCSLPVSLWKEQIAYLRNAGNANEAQVPVVKYYFINNIVLY